MESATFRKWLADRGCRFDHHEHQKRGKGQMIVTVHREGRKAEVPLGGSHQNLDQRVVYLSQRHSRFTPKAQTESSPSVMTKWPTRCASTTSTPIIWRKALEQRR
jgi:hypothetical protein